MECFCALLIGVFCGAILGLQLRRDPQREMDWLLERSRQRDRALQEMFDELRRAPCPRDWHRSAN